MIDLGLHPWTVTLRPTEAVAIDPWSGLLYALAAAVVVGLTLRRPAYGIAALVVFAPFGPIRYVDGTTVTLLKAGVVGLFVAFAIRRPDGAAFGTVPFRAIAVTFAAVEVAIALSATRALHLAPVLREGFKTFEYAALFAGTVSAYASDPDDRPFWRALEVVTALVCLTALGQYIFGANAGIFIGGHSVPRVAGALEGPNQLAGWLEVTIPVLFARNLLHRDGWLVATVFFAAVTEVATFSRAGIVATLFACAIVLIVMRTPRAVGLRFALAATIAATILAFVALRVGVPPRYFSLDQVPQQADHLGNRALLWRAAIDLWATSPVVGVGAGNYEFDLARVGLTNVRTHANSIYLQSLAEGGVVMLCATLGTAITIVVTLARSGIRRPVVVGMLAATVALAAHQIFDDLFFFPKVGSIYWLTLGVAVAEIAAQKLYVARRSGALRTLVER